MKKKTLRVLALALATLMCMTVVPFVTNATDAADKDLTQYTVTNPTDVVDLIQGMKPTIHGHKYDAEAGYIYTAANSSVTKFTDGTYAAQCTDYANNAKSAFCNFQVSWGKSGATSTETASNNTALAKEVLKNPLVKFNVDGTENKYFYALEFKNLSKVTATGFKLFANSNTPTSESAFGEGNLDASFQILVSTDNGITYQCVYSTSNGKKPHRPEVLGLKMSLNQGTHLWQYTEKWLLISQNR